MPAIHDDTRCALLQVCCKLILCVICALQCDRHLLRATCLAPLQPHPPTHPSAPPLPPLTPLHPSSPPHPSQGLGKTAQSISLLEFLRQKFGDQGPFLVVAPLSTLGEIAWGRRICMLYIIVYLLVNKYWHHPRSPAPRNTSPATPLPLPPTPLPPPGHWQREVEAWTDMRVVPYIGSASDRGVIRDYEMGVGRRTSRPRFHLLLTSPEVFSREADLLATFPFRVVVIDEAHRLKSRSSVLFNKLCGAFGIGARGAKKRAPWRLLLTGEGLWGGVEVGVAVGVAVGMVVGAALGTNSLAQSPHSYTSLTIHIYLYPFMIAGTPIQNNVRELYSILSVLNPDRFPPTDDGEGDFLGEFGAESPTAEQARGGSG